MNPLRLIVACLLLLLTASKSQAELHVAHIFQDAMVLQRDVPMPIWGRAAAGEEITVRFAGQTAETTADQDGNWAVTLEPLTVNAQGQSLQVDGSAESKTIEHILVGEVWHACGEANMAMPLKDIAKDLPIVRSHIAKPRNPTIRLCRLYAAGQKQPLDDFASPSYWTAYMPHVAYMASGVPFYFARQLHEELEVPIGIIDSSNWATPIETFMPRAAFAANSTLQKELELGDRDDFDALRRLPGGMNPHNADWLPSRIFNARLAPVMRLPVRGVIWYQGESNCNYHEDPHGYADKMRALIQGWRRAMNDEDLPFYFVQLPASGARPGWPYLREQQRLATDVPHTGMVVTLDIDGVKINPANKIDVGQRLARWALANLYAEPAPFSGPMFEQQEIDGNRIIVHFQHANSGLMIANKEGLDEPQKTPDQKLTYFEIADQNGQWYEADAAINGQTVVVTSGKVKAPIAVRYAYMVSPKDPPLYNRDGLPASPFCSKPELLQYDPELKE